MGYRYKQKRPRVGDLKTRRLPLSMKLRDQSVYVIEQYAGPPTFNVGDGRDGNRNLLGAALIGGRWEPVAYVVGQKGCWIMMTTTEWTQKVRSTRSQSALRLPEREERTFSEPFATVASCLSVMKGVNEYVGSWVESLGTPGMFGTITAVTVPFKEVVVAWNEEGLSPTRVGLNSLKIIKEN